MKYRYTAIARRWFDKVNGNTYHSVRITDNETGKAIAVPFQYGYGDCYRQTALQAMCDAGWLPEQYHKEPYMYERENDYPINWCVTDGLKRDCVANGTL
jgi:hypothetical protein